MTKSIFHPIYRICTILVALWCLGILAAPLLRHAGLHESADITYAFFSRICHQNDMNSFHVEGEKLGVCIRCSAIYFGFLAGLMILPMSGAMRKGRIPNPWVIISVMVPMGLDVLLNDTGLHISTTWTRVVTGLLFGGVMPWCIIPLFIEACSQLIQKRKIQSLEIGGCTNVRKTQ